MRICVIIPSFYPAVLFGGPIFSTLNLYKELSKDKDIEVFVSTTNSNMNQKLDIEVNKYLKLEENFFVKYYKETILNRFSFKFLFNISKDIKKSDVVHIQSIFSFYVAVSLFFSFLFNKYLIISPRGSLSPYTFTNRGFLKRLWIKSIIKPFSKKIIWHATSLQEKKEILNSFPNANIRIIPNGVDLSQFKTFNELTKKEFLEKFANKKTNEIDKIIVSMGRLNKKKRFDLLIESFIKIQEKYKESYLFIAGPDGGELKNLLKLVKRLHLEQKVFLVGNLEFNDKVDFLANADLFILPSYNENFGNVYLESLSLGVPIIASKDTPWEEIEIYNCGKWIECTKDSIYNSSLDLLSKEKSFMHKNCIELAKKYEINLVSNEFKKLYKSKELKILFLSNIPTPYQLNFLESINKLDNTKIFAFFMQLTNKNRNWNLTLPEYVHVENYNKSLKNYINLYKYIKENNINKIVITGYSLPMALFAILVGKINYIESSFWLERPMYKRKGIKGKLKKIYIKFMFNRVEKVFSIGNMAKKIYSKFHNNVVNLPYSMNLTNYYNVKREKKDNLIKFLFVGQYIERKNILNTILAFKKVKNENIRLYLGGSGEQEKEVNSLIKDDKRIINLGYIQPNEIYEIYGSNDIFLMPSRHDGWALVINEAMAAGMPIISTRKVGATVEYIKHKMNGFICTTEVESIADGIEFYSNNPQLIGKHGRINKELMLNSLGDTNNSSKNIREEFKFINKKKRLDIGYLTGSYSLLKGGGVTTVIESLVNNLSENIIVFAESCDKSQKIKKYNVLEHEYLISIDLLKKLKSMDIDILHVHLVWRFTSLATIFWHIITGKPYIVSPHGMLDQWALKKKFFLKKLVFELIEKHFLNNAFCIHALCESEAHAIKQLNIKSPIRIIPNAIDLPSLKKDDLEYPFGKNHEKNKLLFLGRLDKKKGILELLESINKIKNEMEKSNWMLVIAGFGKKEFEDEILSLIDKYSLSNVVDFIGSVFDKKKSACYYHSDAFILPSFSEGLPMSILEAWSFKLPVLMTKECNFEIGFKTNSAIEIDNNIDILGEQLKSLFKYEKNKLFNIGENGYNLVKEHYSYNEIKKRYTEMYKEANETF